MHAAHAVGLVHRNVKPSNALLTGHDFVYLVGFGIAHDAAATKLTRAGMIVGSSADTAPERFTTGAADARADIYALAGALYECLTGAQPYPGDRLEQQFTGHFSLDPPRPSDLNAAFPAGFDGVIARGTPTVLEPPPPPPPVRPVVRPSRRRRRLKWPALAGTVPVVVAVAGVTGYLLRPQASAPGTSTAQPGMLPGQTAQPTTSSGQTALPFNGLQGPGGVAADNAGDVYVADTGNSPLLDWRRAPAARPSCHPLA